MRVLFLLSALVGLSLARTHGRSMKFSLRAARADLTCNCGWRNAGRIVGGKETKPNEYPWMVSLSNGCGGSIVTPWHVLTAAHCTDSNVNSPSNIQITVGGHYKSGGNEKSKKTYRIAKIIVHSGWSRNTALNDISLMVTANEISFNQFVGPVCMPTRKLSLDGTYIKVMGWGSTMGTASENALREVDLKVTPLMECRKHWPKVSPSGTQLCAWDHRKDSCNGDSGGPLVYLDPETNTFTQAALVSFGDEKCGTSSLPSVNTDVSSYIDWINKSIASSKPGAKICSKR